MRREPVPRPLDEVVRSLVRPLLRAGALGRWRLAGWDAEQGITLVVTGDRGPLLIECEDRDESRDCSDRTARFNVCARHMFNRERALDETERSVLDRVVAVLREREGALPTDRAATSKRALVREILVERLLMPEGGGHYYVNPYVGCTIGCEFCYVSERADLSRRLEGLPELPWGRYLDVKVNAAEVLRKEVARARPGIVRLSPILTDPYQPAERTYRVTRQCIEVLLEAGFAPVVLTRSALVVEDLPLLGRFARAAVGFSIPTNDDGVRRAFEPGAEPIEARIEALEATSRAGVSAFVVVQPMLPMDPDELVARTAPFVVAARIDRMHLAERCRHLYEDAGMRHATSDEFFRATESRLRAGFERAGVRIDDLDDLARIVGPAPRRPFGDPPPA